MRRTKAFVLTATLLAAGSSCASGPGTGSVDAVFGRDADTHALYVREVREGPMRPGAEGDGLMEGDQVMMIEGLYVRDLSEKQLRAELRGEIGSPVALTILRGNEVLHVRVTRSARRAPLALPSREQKIAE